MDSYSVYIIFAYAEIRLSPLLDLKPPRSQSTTHRIFIMIIKIFAERFIQGSRDK